MRYKMKQFFLIVLSFIILNLITHAKASTGSSLRLEGSCRGTLKDGSPIVFSYFSNFNGCSNRARAAVNFTSGIEGLLTGRRAFSGDKDIYSFPDHKIILKNSTGNTDARFHYKDMEGKSRSVTVQCEIRDYEYADC